MLTLWAYFRYTIRSGRAWYMLTLLLLCFGLMAKQMLVTLPIVLLLLDLWPLRRGTRILEKLPFFAVSFSASVVAFLVHQKSGATAASDLIPPMVRVEDSLVS